MKRKLEITIDQARELLKTTPSLRGVILDNFPELKTGLMVNSWKDLEITDGWYISSTSNLIDCTVVEGRVGNPEHRNVFATDTQAVSALAYAQLTQLMKATSDCDDLDWNDNTYKYTIYRTKTFLCKGDNISVYHPIAFRTEAVRDEFLKKYWKLLMTYFQIA